MIIKDFFMELGRIEGTVVSTAKVDRLVGQKLMLVNLINPDVKPTSNWVVAIDAVGAGRGEIVIVVRGSSARQTESLQNVPTDASIVGIVDSIELKGKVVYEKSGGK
jgi:ethanolamine utilization protein EutN